MNATSTLRPRQDDDVVRYTTLIVLRELGRRARNLHEENKRLNRLLRPLIRDTAPGLLEVYGVGYDTAAKVLVAAGDNPQRLHSEAAWAHMCGVAPIAASSGKTQRHRLNRGGNRQANSALYRIMLTRMRHDQRTRDYVARRSAQGKTMGEISRHAPPLHLTRDLPTPPPTSLSQVRVAASGPHGTGSHPSKGCAHTDLPTFDPAPDLHTGNERNGRDRKRACPHTSGSSLSCPTRRARSPIKALDIHTRISTERPPARRAPRREAVQPLDITRPATFARFAHSVGDMR